VPIGNCTTPSIPALGSASFDCLGTIPAGSAAGSYTITATADYNVKIAESSETNNAATDTVTVLASTVDLVAQQLACTSVSFAATCAITVSNPSGTAVPSFRLSVRQSQDATITTSDPEIASCTVGISAGGTTTYTCNGTLLTTSVNVGVFVDADLAVTESSEANNQANASGAWRFPDLDITAMTCTISGADNCVVTITNIGGDAAGPFTVVLRGSADSVYDDLDVFVAMSSVTGLSAGASITLTLVGPDSGAYGVAKVDTANTVLESSESNNTGSATW
jgi:subtilase family serine protease